MVTFAFVSYNISWAVYSWLSAITFHGTNWLPNCLRAVRPPIGFKAGSVPPKSFSFTIMRVLVRNIFLRTHPRYELWNESVTAFRYSRLLYHITTAPYVCPMTGGIAAVLLRLVMLVCIRCLHWICRPT